MRDGEGFLPEPEGSLVVTGGQAIKHHASGDPPKPVLIAERPSGKAVWDPFVEGFGPLQSCRCRLR